MAMEHHKIAFRDRPYEPDALARIFGRHALEVLDESRLSVFELGLF